jgi:putative ABC transport system permease protein
MLGHDLRYAARMLGHHPTFTLVALLTLALGIGANTAIFSVVDTVLLRPAPVADLGRLAVVWETDRATGTTREPGSLPDFFDYRARSRHVERLAAVAAGEMNYAPARGEPVRLQILEVSEDFLPLMGLHPSAGRVFTAEDARPGGPAHVILSDGFWTRALDRDPAVVGRTIHLDDRAYTVIGVMPPGADFGTFQVLRAADYSRSFADRGARAAVDLWLPLQESEKTWPRSTHPMFMIARTRGAVRAVQEEMAVIAADLERQYPENRARGVFVEPLGAVVFGPVRPGLIVLLGAVALVLLVACVNVANLLIARGSARRREVAVRTALGASGLTLVRQFATEGLLLTAIAAAAGVGLAVVGVRALVALAPPEIPRIADAGVDLRVLAVTLGVSIAAGLAFGLIPALGARRTDVQAALRSETGHGASAGRDRSRLRSALVVVEVALAVLLVIGAALLIKSFWRLRQTDPGFRAAGVLKAEYQLPASRYPTDYRRYPNFPEIRGFTRSIVDRVGALPGVASVAVAAHHPLDPGFTNSFRIVGREAEARSQPEISVRRVTAGYFGTMGVPLLSGRVLADSDTAASRPVVVINQAAARRFFPNDDPVGRQIEYWGAARTIVGVVGNERFQGLTEAPAIAAYAPLDQGPSPTGVLLVRTAGEASWLSGSVRAAIRDLDPALAVFGLEPFTQTVSRSVSERRFTMLVLGLLAAVALTLAAIGIHGVLTCIVAERTREIGIRLALGAPPARVRRVVVSRAIALAGLGTALGLLAAFALTRSMSALLFEVTATDTLTFAGVPLLLGLVALGACTAPVRRATRVDPIVALRMD